MGHEGPTHLKEEKGDSLRPLCLGLGALWRRLPNRRVAKPSTPQESLPSLQLPEEVLYLPRSLEMEDPPSPQMEVFKIRERGR